jgi:recombination protein RecA
MKRVRLTGSVKRQGGNDYFPALTPGVECIPTGCALLDCVLGGGWARRRVVNVVGDKSVGKTLLAIEACANFAKLEPKGKIFYREAEGAFDEPYAASLGLPLDRVDFGPEGLDTIWDTVEDIFEDLEAKLAECAKAGVPGLYIVDSLDSLSSRAELGRKPGEATFGLEKQKMMGKLFRQLTRRIKSADMCVMIISQVRDKIGMVFGEKHTRTGGKALDFYASQILWLSHVQKLTRTVGNVKRTTAVRIKAQCKKNKVSLPFRECLFEIEFGFGMRDAEASLAWLEEVKALGKLGTKDPGAFLARLDKLSGAELAKEQERLRAVVITAWQEVEGRFAPTRKKYG